VPKQDNALVGRGVGGHSALGRPEPKDAVAALGIRGRSKAVVGPVLLAAVLAEVIQ
jgi:hypothetical protein